MDLSLLPFVQDLAQSGGQVYLVGGSVRDEFLGIASKDFDLIVTGLEIDQIVTVLKKHGKTNLVGKSFGVIKYIDKKDHDLEFDIALPRKELSTGEGHRDFHVHSDPHLSIEEDLSRRDFTINAIAKNLSTQEITDPFDGQGDLKNKKIRIVFENSFREDPLRLMRAIQLAARFHLEIEADTLTQMKRDAEKIQTVAPERIIEEIRKLFLAEKPSHGFDLMRETGLLEYVFPDIHETIGVTQPNKNNEDVYCHTMKVLDAARAATELEKPGDLEIMFSALFHDTGKPKTKREHPEDEKRVTFYNHQHISTGIAWRWMKDFKIRTIGINPKKVCHLVKHHMFETKEFHNEKALRRFIKKVGKDHVFDLLDLRLADKKGGKFPNKVYGILKLRDEIREEINRKAPFTVKDLALTGHDIIELGFEAGPVIGEIQRHLMEIVLDEPEKNTKETLTEIVNSERENFEK